MGAWLEYTCCQDPCGSCPAVPGLSGASTWLSFEHPAHFHIWCFCTFDFESPDQCWRSFLTLVLNPSAFPTRDHEDFCFLTSHLAGVWPLWGWSFSSHLGTFLHCRDYISHPLLPPFRMLCLPHPGLLGKVCDGSGLCSGMQRFSNGSSDAPKSAWVLLVSTDLLIPGWGGEKWTPHISYLDLLFLLLFLLAQKWLFPFLFLSSRNWLWVINSFFSTLRHFNYWSESFRLGFYIQNAQFWEVLIKAFSSSRRKLGSC